MAEPTQPTFESFLDQETPQLRNKVPKTFQRRSNINIDLQKSIQLLDDAVSPTVNRMTRTPKSAYRQSNYALSEKDSPLSVSCRYPYTPGRSSFRQVKNDDFERSRPLSPMLTRLPGLDKTDNLQWTAEIEMTEDLNQSNISLLSTTNDDANKTLDNLCEAFSSALRDHAAPHQALELLTAYQAALAPLVGQLKARQRAQTRGQPRLVKTSTSLALLNSELQTWQLIKSLFKDRLETEAQDQDMDENADVYTKAWSLSEQNISSHFFDKEADVRQSQLVVDWLETCASEDLDSLTDNAEFFVDQNSVAWENTLHQLQSKKKGLGTSRERPTITEMDPDAPHRQMKALDDLDKDDEHFLLKHLFWCLRAGKIDMAQELCVRCGQPWRAASLEGWRLAHDPALYAAPAAAHPAVPEGNAFRDVWKAACWRMAQEPEVDKYERAAYAALSGNLDALLPVCTSWMDFVWAYFKVTVDVRVEQQLRLHHHTDRQPDDLPQQYWAKLLEPQEIFKEIGASVHESIRMQSKDWYHLIQKFIILGDISGLIETMYSWLKGENDGDAPPQHLLRLMAHIVLFLRSIGHSCKEELCEAVLEAFLQSLISGRQSPLVAHYTAALRPHARVAWYASFLEGVKEQDERSRCLEWARAEGLPVGEITKAVVERVRATNTGLPPTDGLVPDTSVTEEDQAKIDAIDWLVFEDGHRTEAMRQANAIMRAFIVVRKHVAARQAFLKLPVNSIEVISRNWNMLTGNSIEDLPAEEANIVREYMCMKAYLDAVESFNDWFQLFHSSPAPPPAVPAPASFTDRVAAEHRMKQYNQEHDRWKLSLVAQTKTTRDKIYNVLLFADGGWMVDSAEECEPDTERQHQMASLRRLHLPWLCQCLHSVLHQAGLYAQAVQMADVIASDQHQLYMVFDKESLQHLLGQIAKSSRSLLDEDKDPLGYEVV